jgi:hypothetical protein
MRRYNYICIDNNILKIKVPKGKNVFVKDVKRWAKK